MTPRLNRVLLGILVAMVLMEVSCVRQQQPSMFAAPGAIPIIAPSAGQCDANPRTAFLNYPATNLAVQWTSTTGIEYKVVFQAGDDPFNPDGDMIDVPANGVASNSKTVLAQAQTDCNNGKNCIYNYTIKAADGSSCAPTGASPGLVIKPGT